jgi:hypothetical protein
MYSTYIIHISITMFYLKEPYTFRYILRTLPFCWNCFPYVHRCSITHHSTLHINVVNQNALAYVHVDVKLWLYKQPVKRKKHPTTKLRLHPSFFNQVIRRIVLGHSFCSSLNFLVLPRTFKLTKKKTLLTSLHRSLEHGFQNICHCIDL